MLKLTRTTASIATPYRYSKHQYNTPLLANRLSVIMLLPVINYILSLCGTDHVCKPFPVYHPNNIVAISNDGLTMLFELLNSLWGLTPMWSNTADLRSLPAAHHGEVCDYQSSVGSYRSPCFVYNFFRNVYFFFMGSDPNVSTHLSQS